MPLGLAMALIGFFGVWYVAAFDIAFLGAGKIIFNMIASYHMAVLPLFVLMADLIFQAGFGRTLFEAAYKWAGRLPGGLAVATIGAAAIFSAVSASSIACAVTIGRIAIPEMERTGYDDKIAIGAVTGGGSLGILIPPSGMMIIYGILTEQSIGRLFMAGVVPGVILALLFMLMIITRGILNPNLCPPGPSVSWTEKIRSLAGVIEVGLMILLVLGGLVVGWFTPTESAAIGAGGALVICLARRRLTWRGFKEAIYTALLTTGLIYMIIGGSYMFNAFLTLTRMPYLLADFIAALPVPAYGIMAGIIIVYLILGGLISSTAMIVLTVPIFFPIILALDFDPIWFGVIIVLMCEMGGITPPVGLVVFAVKGILPQIPLGTIFRALVPFLIIFLCFAVLLVAFPQIALFFPRLLFGS
jgi:C4-dicarboxylate transporter DctM subunit